MLITEYLVVTGNQPDGLTIKVNKAIAEGWQPFGAPVVQKFAGLHQAMVRYQQADLNYPLGPG
jgi:hypothetical protein